MGSDKCMSCAHHDSVIQNSFTDLKTMFSTYLPLVFFPQTLVTIDRFMTSILSPFPEYLTVGVIPYIPLSDCLLSLKQCELTGGCDDRHAKCTREELPHVPGQGQKLGGPHTRRAQPRGVTPTSEARGSDRQCQAATEELLKSEVRGGGREELPHVLGQGRQPGGPTSRPRSGGCAGAGGPRGVIPC